MLYIQNSIYFIIIIIKNKNDIFKDKYLIKKNNKK